MKIKVIYTTFDSEKEALLVAEILVKENLAAGVNINPIKSIFRWKGEIIRREEYALHAQTEASICFNVVSRIVELHSYEIPCIEVYTPTTTTLFGQWMHTETLRAQKILPEQD